MNYMHFNPALTLLITVATATLTACGGGTAPIDTVTQQGAGMATYPVSWQATDEAALAPVRSVAAASYSGSFAEYRAGVFAALNAVRESVGLGLLAQDSRLDAAAQAHSESHYQSHNEASGADTYSLWDRATKAGYPWAGDGKNLSEVMNFFQEDRPAGQIESELNSVYHRMPLLSYRFADVGVGYTEWLTTGVGPLRYASLTIDFGATATKRQAAPDLPFVVWPKDGMTVPRVDMVAEDPDPDNRRNGQYSRPFGYPASIHVDQAKTIKVTLMEMRDANGALVPGRVLTVDTDAHFNKVDDKGWAVYAPNDWLPENSTYTVTFKGESVYNSVSAPISTTWSFKTPAEGYTTLWCGSSLAYALYSSNSNAVFERDTNRLGWLSSFKRDCIAPRADIARNWYPAACLASMQASDLSGMVANCRRYRGYPWSYGQTLADN